jgi:hypothetical protein
MLLQKTPNDRWAINGLNANEELNLAAVDALLRNLTRLTIVGVLPKPAGITASLRSAVSSTTLTREDRDDLTRKGFYLSPDGQLISNRGELVIRTIRGVFYTLRFGDIAPGTDAPAADPTPPAGANPPTTSPRENRYLFIMVDFDAQSARTPGRASEGAERAQLLRARFAPWYYVIAADSFAQIRPQRRDLVTRKSKPAL